MTSERLPRLSKVLVVGSYPPVPGPASAATMAAVRRAWADGYDVEVVSPRPSAADRTARVQGMRAGWQLSRLRRQCGADALVLCLEIGMPLDPAATAVHRRYQTALLRRAFRGFQRVSLVVADDMGEDLAALSALWPNTTDVVVANDETRQAMIRMMGMPAAIVRVDARWWEQPTPSHPSYATLPEELPVQASIRQRAARLRETTEPVAPVTPFGPPEWNWYEQPRRFASLAARRLLGRHTDAVRTGLVRLLRGRPAA